MTGPEREDFRELRAEIRDSFGDIAGRIAELAKRISSLETSRDVAVALQNRERRDAERDTTESRFRATMVLGLGTTVIVEVIRFLGLR